MERSVHDATGRAGVDGPSAKNGEVPPEDQHEHHLHDDGRVSGRDVVRSENLEGSAGTDASRPDLFERIALSMASHAPMICAVAVSSP